MVELGEKDFENPPWNKDFDAWEYRRVKFKGRAVFGKGNLIF
jgi:hypothetical protein